MTTKRNVKVCTYSKCRNKIKQDWSRGRTRLFCSKACKQADYRERVAK